MKHFTISTGRRIHPHDAEPQRFLRDDVISIQPAGSEPQLQVIRYGNNREPVTVLDVHLTSSRQSEQRFDRQQGRGHDPSDPFRGEIRHIQLGKVEVLVGLVGHKSTGDAEEDDDTEVFVATSGPDPVG